MVSEWIGCPSANFHVGRHGYRPEAIVVHIMDGTFAAGESVFLDASTQKSAHYGIDKTGVVHQYVDENDTAFHAGIVVNPAWSLLKAGVNPNFYTVGIEHAGLPGDVWPDEQLDASAELILQVGARWGIPLDTDHVIRHHQIRASKTCPGNWLEIETLLGRISNVTTPHPVANNTLQTIRDVNLRQARPSTSAPVVRVIAANTSITVVGFVPGERVQGNSYWYADADGNYVWAGATNVPNPRPVG